jgi:hypothetical protein
MQYPNPTSYIRKGKKIENSKSAQFGILIIMPKRQSNRQKKSQASQVRARQEQSKPI